MEQTPYDSTTREGTPRETAHVESQPSPQNGEENVPPPPSYESICTASNVQQPGSLTGNGNSATDEDKPPPYFCDAHLDLNPLSLNGAPKPFNSSVVPETSIRPAYTSPQAFDGYPQSITAHYPPQPTRPQPIAWPPVGRTCAITGVQPSPQVDIDRTGALRATTGTYLLLSILTCLCCNPFCGCIAIGFSLAAQHAAETGNERGARERSRNALVCCAFGIVLSLMTSMFYWISVSQTHNSH